MKIELPKNWKLLAGMPISEAIDPGMLKKVDSFIRICDQATIKKLEKMIDTRKDQLKKNINDLNGN
jgi:hypothetical protein